MPNPTKFDMSDADIVIFEELCRRQYTRDEVAKKYHVRPATLNRYLVEKYGLTYKTAYKRINDAMEPITEDGDSRPAQSKYRRHKRITFPYGADDRPAEAAKTE